MSEIERLNIQIKALQKRNQVLEKRVQELESGFVTIDAASFISSLQNELMQTHDFAMSRQRPTSYVLSDFSMQLKAIVTQKDNKSAFILPSKLEATEMANLSVVNVVLRPVPLSVPPEVKPRPVDAIEGIGTIWGGKLKAVGIENVLDLALATPEDLVKCGISKKRAPAFISMAKLMVKGNLAGVEGVDEQAAEMLVTVARIESKEELAASDPATLFNKLNEAMSSGKIKVPRTYVLTKEDVEVWINSAKVITGRYTQ